MDVDTWPWKLPKGMPLFLNDTIGRPVRTVRPGEVITLEYRSGRITFFLDDAGLVTDIGYEPELPATLPA
ncbi:MAG TPA: I78 family peptidase inhibitor [Telluria sp.]